MGRRKLFTPESVERALDVHVPGRWSRLAMSNGGPGYVVQTTDIGEVHFRTLKEARAFVVGCAESNQAARADA